MRSKYDHVALTPKPRISWANKLVTNEIKYVVETPGRFYGFVAPLLAALGLFKSLTDTLNNVHGCDSKGFSASGVKEIELCKHFNMVKVDLTKTHILPLFLNHGCYLISGHIQVEGKKVGRTVAVSDGELLFYDCKKILHKYGVANDILLPRYDNKLAKGNGCLDTISRVYALFHLGIARTRFLSKATSLASSSAPSSLSSEVPSSLASEVPSSSASEVPSSSASEVLSSVPSSLASGVLTSVPSSLAASEVPSSPHSSSTVVAASRKVTRRENGGSGAMVAEPICLEWRHVAQGKPYYVEQQFVYDGCGTLLTTNDTLGEADMGATDDQSCAMDAFNAGAGQIVLTRESVGVLQGPINFDDPNGSVRHALRAAGYDLKAVARPKKPQPRFEDILGQRSGIFLVEFYWRKPDGSDWHVVAVNCDQRRVFCNTLGGVPFHKPEVANESAKTHLWVKQQFSVNSVLRVWWMLRRQPVLPLMTSPSAPQPACFPITIQPAFVGNEPETSEVPSSVLSSLAASEVPSSVPSSLASEVHSSVLSSLASEVHSSVPSSLASGVSSSAPFSLAASEVPPIVPLMEPPSDKQPACFPIPIQPTFEEVSAVTVEHDRASPASGRLTCLVDAVVIGIMTLVPTFAVSLERLRTLSIPDSGNKQRAKCKLIDDAFVKLNYPFQLRNAMDSFREAKGGLMLNLLSAEPGVYLAGLKVVLDGKEYKHCVMVSTIPEEGKPHGKMIDNHSGMKPVYLEAGDRLNKPAAKWAFKKLMAQRPEAKGRTDIAVEIVEIYQLQGPNELRNFLVDCRLPNNYYKVLMDAGWDDLNYMKGVDENSLKTELKQIDMKPGHVAKFIDQLKKLPK